MRLGELKTVGSRAWCGGSMTSASGGSWHLSPLQACRQPRVSNNVRGLQGMMGTQKAASWKMQSRAPLKRSGFPYVSLMRCRMSSRSAGMVARISS